MKFYILSPEVAGGLGRKTTFDRFGEHRSVVSLHYEFEGWNGDDLITSFPVFLVTERAARTIESAQVRGYAFAPTEITKSEQFELIHPEIRVPQFIWMKVTGEGGKDEIGLSRYGSLVVSEQVLNLLKSFTLNHCEIRPAEEEEDPKQELQKRLERGRARVQRDFPRKKVH